ncbi:hypothetical protein [Paramagnetospirillum magnetotacticum]|uniref:hypothetical protein n=1 Tax=Paramagnetospirillum magnetotacticum TaxID=188 RepID=UPI000038478A|nr:hypothetical protein [Paramagnetospirillum magnetotacticum]
MGLSVRAYARHRGVSHVAVMKAARSGRIPQEADGTIDPIKADAAWDAQTDPAKRPQAPRPPTSPATKKLDTAPPKVNDTPPAASFTQARTMHEVAKAQRARIQVAKLKDEVVDRSKALALVFKLARQERDSWVTWPARVAAQMAVEAGIEPHTMQTLLEAHVRAHLAELSDIRPEFR